MTGSPGAGNVRSLVAPNIEPNELADAALLCVLEHLDLAGVEPHAVAVVALVDLHVVVLDLLQSPPHFGHFM